MTSHPSDFADEITAMTLKKREFSPSELAKGVDYQVMFDDLVGLPIDHSFDEMVPDYVRVNALAEYKVMSEISLASGFDDEARRCRRSRKIKRHMKGRVSGSKVLSRSAENDLSLAWTEALGNCLTKASEYWMARCVGINTSIMKEREAVASGVSVGSPPTMSAGHYTADAYAAHPASLEAHIARFGLVRGVQFLKKRREFFTSLYYHYIVKSDCFEKEGASDSVKSFRRILIALFKGVINKRQAAGEFMLRYRAASFSVSLLMPDTVSEETARRMWAVKTLGIPGPMVVSEYDFEEVAPSSSAAFGLTMGEESSSSSSSSSVEPSLSPFY